MLGFQKKGQRNKAKYLNLDLFLLLTSSTVGRFANPSCALVPHWQNVESGLEQQFANCVLGKPLETQMDQVSQQGLVSIPDFTSD